MADEMGCLKKAVGFTEGTIKRWFAARSPKPNDQPTEDVDEPTTPVRTTEQQQSPESPSAPQRKASKAIDLSDNLNSTPSVRIEESHTPPGSPSRLTSEGSIDKVKALLRDRGFTLPAQEDPLITINDPAVVSLTFVHDDSFEIARKQISLDASPADLSTLIGQLCYEWRQSRAEYMRSLLARNQGVHMVSKIHFEDHRDNYVSGDQHGINRFDTLRDFFEDEELNFLPLTGDLPIIPHLVTITVIDLASIDRNPPKPLSQLSHHRIARWRIAPSPANPKAHEPLSQGVYVRYDKSNRTLHPSFLEIRERKINGVAIGSFSNTRPLFKLPRQETLEPQYSDCDLSNLGAVHKLIKRNVMWNMMKGKEDTDIPHLPRLTFRELDTARVDTNRISNEKIHLAIRLVNGIKPLHAIHLPTNILMTVQPGHKTTKTIKSTLYEELWKYANHFQFDITGIKLLYHEKKDENGTSEAFWGGHRMDLWVLPQKGDTMYLFEKGSLKWFLDNECVEKGNRRLYVEAWILPGGGQEEGGLVEVQWGSDSD